MSVGRAFFDTNVLLYMFSTAEPGKQERARKLFEDYQRAEAVVLSTQVVQEFYAGGLRKLALPRATLAQLVQAFLSFPTIANGPDQIRRALEIEERHKISFWDALIVSAAEAARAEVLFTEDLNDGQRYGSVVARNPFKHGDTEPRKSAPKRRGITG